MSGISLKTTDADGHEPPEDNEMHIQVNTHSNSEGHEKFALYVNGAAEKLKRSLESRLGRLSDVRKN
jgi:hypothetical protein